MVRIRRTKDVEQHVRYGSVYGTSVEFAAGDDVTAADVDDAFWVVEQFDHLELAASHLPTDYPTLRSLASAADDDAASGNDPKPELIEWFDSLADDRREELLEEIGELDGDHEPEAGDLDLTEADDGDDAEEDSEEDDGESHDAGEGGETVDDGEPFHAGDENPEEEADE